MTNYDLDHSNNISKDFSDPFPHIIIDNFIDVDNCQEIIRELDEVNNKIKVENVMGGRSRFYIKDFLETQQSTQLYKKFNNINQFNLFSKKLNILAENSIKKFNFKNLFKSTEKKKQNNIFLRIKKKFFKHLLSDKIFLDIDYSIGNAGYNREPHHDAPNKILVFLLYLNTSKETNEGGALEIYKYKYNFSNNYLQQHDKENL